MLALFPDEITQEESRLAVLPEELPQEENHAAEIASAVLPAEQVRSYRSRSPMRGEVAPRSDRPVRSRSRSPPPTSQRRRQSNAPPRCSGPPAG